MRKDYLSSTIDFNMLSLGDLIEARDYYHVFLTHKENVMATAVGRYRIRSSEPWPDQNHPTQAAVAKQKASVDSKKIPRTLTNSEVRPYSWPCILVFVSKWKDQVALEHEDSIPNALYMPDGRKVPVCVVEAPKATVTPPVDFHIPGTAGLLGGGLPLITAVQGTERIASIGGIVTDGHCYYALTNKHVCGEPGTPVYTLEKSRTVRVGIASEKQIGKLTFAEMYPDWVVHNVLSNADVGLVKIDNINRWTSAVQGISQIGQMADLNSQCMSMRLIGCPLKAHGAVSGSLTGEIQALFYRYKSIGGIEYVCDFLIGPRKGEANVETHHGDSGTWWFTDIDGEPSMPIAVQWGGHRLISDSQSVQFALASNLSRICALLDIDVVPDLKANADEYWGACGHYTIAAKACAAVDADGISELMKNNLLRISFADDDINKRNFKGLSKREYIPLADVPDMVWKMRVGDAKRPNEGHNHFADMDKLNQDGKTLLDICKNKKNVDPEVWLNYYKEVKDSSRGLLPFRCWQIFDEMLEYARKGKKEEFVCAAGILAHYIGDSCQPLHISSKFNGDHDRMTDGTPYGDGVHEAYETDMVNEHTVELLAGIDEAIKSGLELPDILSGQDAAIAVVKLMQETFALLEPDQIIEGFMNHPERMWEDFGTATTKTMINGVTLLAGLWQSAWINGKSKIKNFNEIPEADLADIYKQQDFLPSYTLAQMIDQKILKVPAAH